MYAEMSAAVIRGALAQAGLSPIEIEQAHSDLNVILEAQRKQPELDYALTFLADQALHVMLDQPETSNLVEAMHGLGARQVHNADAWATPLYLRAWENTRQAFSENGVELDADPAAPRSDGRAGAFCIRSIERPSQ